MKNYVFDLETVPLPTDQLEALLPDFDMESVKVGNLGQQKAEEKIAKAEREHFQNFYRKAALSPLTGQIAMIGLRDEDRTARILEGSEPEIIQEWLNLFDAEGSKHFIGFNIASFDIPFLIRRAWFHRIKVPYGLVRGRYLTGLLTDLLELWNLSERGSERFPVSLDDLGRYFGCGFKTGSGAQFHELLRYQPDEARTYLLNDLELTWKIAEAMGAIRGPVPLAAALKPGSELDRAMESLATINSEVRFY
jgi:hypothetical protein